MKISCRIIVYLMLFLLSLGYLQASYTIGSQHATGIGSETGGLDSAINPESSKLEMGLAVFCYLPERDEFDGGAGRLVDEKYQILHDDPVLGDPGNAFMGFSTGGAGSDVDDNGRFTMVDFTKLSSPPGYNILTAYDYSSIAGLNSICQEQLGDSSFVLDGGIGCAGIKLVTLNADDPGYVADYKTHPKYLELSDENKTYIDNNLDDDQVMLWIKRLNQRCTPDTFAYKQGGEWKTFELKLDMFAYPGWECWNDTLKDNYACNHAEGSYLSWLHCAGDDYEPPGAAEEVVIDWDFVREDSFNIRYEGNCYLHTMKPHEYYHGGEVLRTFSFDQSTGQPEYDTILMDEFHYVVDWDNDAKQCQDLGGVWNDFAPNDGRCCGDDWIWINNAPNKYFPNMDGPDFDLLIGSGKLCYYESGVEQVYTADGKVLEYDCLVPRDPDSSENTNLAYDSYLKRDDDSKMFAQRGNPFWFAGFMVQGNTPVYDETDIGKHGNFYCRHYTDPVLGDKFQWMTLHEAAEIPSQIICELHLGLDWTGTQCCGPGDETFNDPVVSCNATAVGYTAAQTVMADGFSIASDEFNDVFNQRCRLAQNRKENKACYKGFGVSNNTAAASSTAFPDKKDILNQDGILRACQPATGAAATLPTGSPEPYPKCSIAGNKYPGEQICSYYKDSWVAMKPSGTAINILGYNARSRTVNVSMLPAAIPQVPGFTDRECCFDGGCWNGRRCVDNASFYQIMAGEDEMSDFDGNPTEDKDIYMCLDNKWEGPLKLSYDWNHNKDNYALCGKVHSCACVGDSDCQNEKDVDSCTATEGFFNGDNYCQPLIDADGNITGARWSSRAKILAIQLLDLVEDGEDFSLFCDSYERSVNYGLHISQVASSVNSICVLNSSSGVVMGFSLNVDDNDNKPTVYDTGKVFGSGSITDTLFRGMRASYGVSSGINCGTAINNAKTERHGTFIRCNAPIWFNKKLLSVIYSQGGIGEVGELPEPDWSYYEAYFKRNMDAIPSALTSENSYKDVVYAADFNRLHIIRKDGKQMFSFVEDLHDNHFGGGVKHYLVARYDNIPNTSCDNVFSNENIKCITINSTSFATASKSGDFSYLFWPDMSARLRLS